MEGCGGRGQGGNGRETGRGRVVGVEKCEVNFDTFAQMTTVTSKGKYRKLYVAGYAALSIFANNRLETAPR